MSRFSAACIVMIVVTMSIVGCLDVDSSDEDGDGVEDSIDECTGTGNYDVDSNGCAINQLDDDRDSVTNDMDICPSTNLGSKVDSNGCANYQIDFDNDLVLNDFDLCPDTVPTVKVDSNGCADYQLDDDGDGVSNLDDNCPFTPIDEDVDNFGCHGGSVITWGWGFAGGNSSSVESKLSGVLSIHSGYSSFAALKSDGSVVIWGGPLTENFNALVDSELNSDVVEIYSSQRHANSGFAAQKTNGTIVLLGSLCHGGDYYSTIDYGIIQDFSANSCAMAVLKSDGSVSTWGLPSYGGDSNNKSRYLSNVSELYSNERAFAALRTDGVVITWGHPDYGGDGSEKLSLTDVVEYILQLERLQH